VIEVRQLYSLEESRKSFADIEVINPFSSLEWLEIMFNKWEHLFPSGNPFLLGVYKDGDLCGIAPFSKDTIKIKGIIPVKIIKFFHTTYSDYCDFISKVGLQSEVMSNVLEYLRGEDQDWDILWLTEIPQWSETNNILPGLVSKSGLHYFTGISNRCYRIPLPVSWNDYYTQMGKHRRSNFRNYKNKLNKLGEVIFGVASKSEISTAISAFFDLHQKQWNSKGKPGVFSTGSILDVFYVLLIRMFESGFLRLFYMKLNEKYIATAIRFACGETLYGWLEGRDPDYNHLRVGTTLQVRIIEYAISKGFKIYDLMRGDHAYKEDLGAESLPNIAYGISRSRIKLHLFQVLEQLQRYPHAVQKIECKD
jgi:hypothetical protein